MTYREEILQNDSAMKEKGAFEALSRRVGYGQRQLSRFLAIEEYRGEV